MNKKYPARRKSVDKKLAINVIHTAKNQKYMHIDFAINVIQTAKYRIYAYMKIVHVLYDVTIDVIPTAKSQNYVRIEKRTVKYLSTTPPHAKADHYATAGSS